MKLKTALKAGLSVDECRKDCPYRCRTGFCRERCDRACKALYGGR